MTLSYDSLYQAVLKMLEGFGIEAQQKNTKGVVLVGEIQDIAGLHLERKHQPSLRGLICMNPHDSPRDQLQNGGGVPYSSYRTKPFGVRSADKESVAQSGQLDIEQWQIARNKIWSCNLSK